MTVLRTVAATPGQRLLWMMEHYRGADSPLNVPTFYRLRGPLDRPALSAALDALVARHEALRTTYAASRSGVLMEIHEPAPVRLRHEVVGDDPAALEAAMVRAARERFDLAGTVFHTTLLEVTAELVRVGTRSRVIDFTVTVVGRGTPEVSESSARMLPDPLVATTATGTVVVPAK